jgi:hypothetical protein
MSKFTLTIKHNINELVLDYVVSQVFLSNMAIL